MSNIQLYVQKSKTLCHNWLTFLLQVLNIDFIPNFRCFCLECSIFLSRMSNIYVVPKGRRFYPECSMFLSRMSYVFVTNIKWLCFECLMGFFSWMFDGFFFLNVRRFVTNIKFLCFECLMFFCLECSMLSFYLRAMSTVTLANESQPRELLSRQSTKKIFFWL